MTSHRYRILNTAVKASNTLKNLSDSILPFTKKNFLIRKIMLRHLCRYLADDEDAISDNLLKSSYLN